MGKHTGEHTGKQENQEAMEMAQKLQDVLPSLTKLALIGLHGDSDHPKLIFETKDFVKSGISKEKR